MLAEKLQKPTQSGSCRRAGADCEYDPRTALGRAWRDRISVMTNTLTAKLRTSQGTIVVRLLPDHAPKTVQNFVELAEGSREWADPASRQKTKARLYDGTIFH